MSRFTFTARGLISHKSHTIRVAYGFDPTPIPGYFYQVFEFKGDSEELLLDWDTRETMVTLPAPEGRCVSRTEIANSLQVWIDLLSGKYANDDTVSMLRKHIIEMFADIPLSG